MFTLLEVAYFLMVVLSLFGSVSSHVRSTLDCWRARVTNLWGVCVCVRMCACVRVCVCVCV